MYQIFNLLDDSAGENARVNKVTDQFHLRFIFIVEVFGLSSSTHSAANGILAMAANLLRFESQNVSIAQAYGFFFTLRFS